MDASRRWTVDKSGR